MAIPLINHGFEPYQQYLQISPLLLNLPYIDGFPGYLLVTIYGFLATLMPDSAAGILAKLVYPLMIIYGLALALLAYGSRTKPSRERIPVLILAVLYPLIASPYVLFHDLLVLFPVFVLWSYYRQQNRYLLISITLFYFGGLVLPIASFYFQVAVMVIIPLAVFVGILKSIQIKPSNPLNTD